MSAATERERPVFSSAEGGRLAEDAAAQAIAALLAGPNLVPAAPRHGRCDLRARGDGVLLVDRERVEALNLIDEAVGLATLPPLTAVRDGDTAATVKIVPSAVEPSLVAAWREQARGRVPLRLAPLGRRRAALILGESGAASHRRLDAVLVSTRRRLAALGGVVDVELRCPHETGAFARAIAEAVAGGAELVIAAGASSARERDDALPAALLAAGGTIDRLGMPAHPGSLLLLGRVGAVPVIGLPGCAGSTRMNGLDVVLPALLAGVALGPRDIAGLGVGGLLRQPQDEERPAGAGARVAALVLAAGRSSRMGERNKLLCEVGGVTMVRRAVEAALASRCRQVMVVTGFDAVGVEAALAGCPVSRVHNPNHDEGMASSLRCGLAALPPDIDGVLVMLADMPWVGAADIDRLVAAFERHDGAIVVPQHGGRRGNPVLWPRRHFAEMQALTGDTGARGLLARHAAEIRTVAFDDDAILIDVDTPAALAAATAP